jgi:hypothetical protein
MKMIGERGLNDIPPGKLSKSNMAAVRRVGKTVVHFNCKDCSKPSTVKVSQLKRWGLIERKIEELICYDCRMAGKKELQQAQIALARRKGLIP